MRLRASIGILVICSAATALLLLKEDVQARACRVSLLPNGGKFQCSNCHLSQFGGGTRNAFGNAVGPLVGLACNNFWNAQIAALDSDGDGRTNGEELGDPLGVWTPGRPDPGTRALVTNPGVRSFLRGDFNTDGTVDLSDTVATLEYLFRAGPAPKCRAAANANDDSLGAVDIGDALRVLFFLFAQTNLPQPFPACGNTMDDNDCQSYLSCR